MRVGASATRILSAVPALLPPAYCRKLLAEKLITQLQSASRWDGHGTLDWSLALRNLKRSLDTAISSRRRDQGVWHLRGPLIELVGDDW
jgi:hypothetical protein